MRALITGAAGFIGSNLAKELVRRGVTVDMNDNMSNGYFHFIDELPGLKLFCDFTDELVLSRIRDQRYDVVFHMAAVPRIEYSVEKPAETTEENLNKAVRLLEACKGNVERFIFSSSSAVYGNTDMMPTPSSHVKRPRSPYALQKSCVEEFVKMFCQLYDFDAICLRYFNVFGPNCYGDNPYATAVAAWCDAVKRNKPLRSDGDGEQSRDLCYVGNVVQANILAATTRGHFIGECLNVGYGGDRISNNQILAWFRNRFPGVQVVNAPERPGDVKHTQADISETKRLIGYDPKVSFWDGLEETIEWWDLK